MAHWGLCVESAKVGVLTMWSVIGIYLVMILALVLFGVIIAGILLGVSL